MRIPGPLLPPQCHSCRDNPSRWRRPVSTITRKTGAGPRTWSDQRLQQPQGAGVGRADVRCPQVGPGRFGVAPQTLESDAEVLVGVAAPGIDGDSRPTAGRRPCLRRRRRAPAPSRSTPGSTRFLHGKSAGANPPGAACVCGGPGLHDGAAVKPAGVAVVLVKRTPSRCTELRGRTDERDLSPEDRRRAGPGHAGFHPPGRATAPRCRKGSCRDRHASHRQHHIPLAGCCRQGGGGTSSGGSCTSISTTSGW
jgi:hypothetical protein